jgi:hypothetical protein
MAYAERFRIFPNRRVVLVELQCIREHQLDIRGKIRYVFILSPFEVFLIRSLSKERPETEFTYEDVFKALRSFNLRVIEGPELLGRQFHENL